MEKQIFLTCFRRKPSKSENTVLGYKKGSKSDFENEKKSATQKLWVLIFVTFFWEFYPAFIIVLCLLIVKKRSYDQTDTIFEKSIFDYFSR